MKIRSMTATFGKLERARLEPGEGLNLIHAPNEGGKSTWAAFWRAMLYGIDTRDRDRKGHLADKNRWQPWSGAPMAGELELEWQGRDITVRRGPRGSVPFGSFSAVYTGTEEPVPGLTAANCGELLTGVGQEVFTRSAFLGAGELSLTTAPELERRIAALVSSGEENVSFSQAQSRLKDWRNKRQVNRSVGEIPRLEGELAQVRDSLARLEEVTADIARLEEERAALERRRDELAAQEKAHRALAQQQLAQRYARAEEDYRAARTQLDTLEDELARHPLPGREELKRAQGELQYLKVLDEEIQAGEAALKEAEEAYVQAQIAAQDQRFAGLGGGEAIRRAESDVKAWEQARLTEQTQKKRARALQVTSSLLAASVALAQLLFDHSVALLIPGLALLGAAAVCLALSFAAGRRGKRAAEEGARLLGRYETKDPENPIPWARDYADRCQAADAAAQASRTVRGTLNDRKARRENSWADVLHFVHAFAPEVQNEFGCSAALSRALNLEHELAAARERTEERRRRLDDLIAQGADRAVGADAPAAVPAQGPEETARALGQTLDRLEQVSARLNQARGQQRAMGDPAALAARQEELEGALERRRLELNALDLAMDALAAANTRLQERFSPELNRLSGQYMARLTGGKYPAVSLSRELEGYVQSGGDVSPRSALFLSRGTADQLYLAVRLAVCRLCLPERPPIFLDDALAAFDDGRLRLALDLLEELAGGQQILLFSCQQREGEALAGRPGVAFLSL